MVTGFSFVPEFAIMKAKAVALFSGGLDSILAVKLILEQGIEVITLHFVNPFVGSNTRDKVDEMARRLEVRLEKVPLGDDYLEVVRNPRFGYGKNLNPCLDCRIFTLSRAREHMERVGAEFVFTGEVLGERPMSQRRDALRIVERESGLDGRLLRPLSAKLLQPTIPELEGIVDRERLLDIRGRSRKPQMELAAKYGITYYPHPAGGCLLTDPKFSERLRDLFRHNQVFWRGIELLKVGRHFRLPTGQKVVAGRDQADNEQVARLAQGDEVKFTVEGYGSTLALLVGEPEEQALLQAAAICARYSSARTLKAVPVRYWSEDGKVHGRVVVSPMGETELDKYRI